MKKCNKKHTFFNFAWISVTIFMMLCMKCNASCINIKSAQIESDEFGKNEQEDFLSVSNDLFDIFSENYMNDIFQYLETDDTTKEVPFRFAWELLLQGRVADAIKMCTKSLPEHLGKELSEGKNIFVLLVGFSVIASLFYIITDVFKSRQIEEIGYYFLCFSMMLVLGKAFLSIYAEAENLIWKIMEFIKILLPAYAAAIGLSGGGGYAVAYYELILFFIFCVENILLNILLPAVKVYVLLSFMAGIWNEERLKILLNTIKKGIDISMKWFLWGLSSLGIIQGMIMPAVDSLKWTGVKKMISLIPGVGNLSEGISDVFLGSSVLIKNGLGVLITAVLLIVCITKLMRILAVSMMIKLSGAVASLINQSGLITTIDRIAHACFMLWRIVFTSMGLFLLSIAISIMSVRGIT
ncbi:MAG: hypothetical protein E7299_05200 [Lachnospiraceae bacterium]|nr:hypothetical protein [Lachnospiraceae bacterium]